MSRVFYTPQRGARYNPDEPRLHLNKHQIIISEVVQQKLGDRVVVFVDSEAKAICLAPAEKHPDKASLSIKSKKGRSRVVGSPGLVKWLREANKLSTGKYRGEFKEGIWFFPFASDTTNNEAKKSSTSKKK